MLFRFLSVLSLFYSFSISCSDLESINIDQNPVLVGETIYKIPKINNFFDMKEYEKENWLENPQKFEELKENIQKNLPENVPFFPQLPESLKEPLKFLYRKIYGHFINNDERGIGTFDKQYLFVSYGKNTLEPAVSIIQGLCLGAYFKKIKLLFINPTVIQHDVRATNLASYLLQHREEIQNIYTVSSFGKERKKLEGETEPFFDGEKDTKLISNIAERVIKKYKFPKDASFYQDRISIFISVGNDLEENDYKKIVGNFKDFALSMCIDSKGRIVILHFTNQVVCDYVYITDPDNLNEAYEIDVYKKQTRKYINFENFVDIKHNYKILNKDFYNRQLEKDENFENFARNLIKKINTPVEDKPVVSRTPTVVPQPDDEKQNPDNNPPPKEEKSKENNIPFYKTWKFIGITSFSIFSLIAYLIKKGTITIKNPFSKTK